MNLFDLLVKFTVDDTGFSNSVDRAEKKGSNLATTLKESFEKAAKSFAAITAAGGVVVGALVGLESKTEDYRIAMGKLNTAFEAANLGANAAKEAYNAFYAILGDTDTATEASQLLAKLATSAEDVSNWTDIAAGVLGTFGDALPIESLIESTNETAKVGQVIGALADALNWAGISEEEFNVRLAECTTETERNQLIMQTLASTYDEASDAFYRNNEAIVAARENQLKLDESLAKIGESVTVVKSAFLEKFAPAIDTVATGIADFISGIDVESVAEKMQGLVDKFLELTPVIVGATAAVVAYKAASAISGIIDALIAATKGQTVAQAALNAVMNANPFVLVATLVAGLATTIVTLWNTNEDFRNGVIEIWGSIKDFFSNTWNAITGFFSNAWTAITAIWNGSIAQGYFSQIWETIKGIFSAVESVLSGDFQGAWDAIKGIVDGWGDYFSETWDKIKAVFSNAIDIFSEVGGNIVDGIKKGIADAWDALTGWVSEKFNNLVDGINRVLEIRSPSRVFARIGEYMAEGVGVGWNDQFDSIKRGIEDDMNFGTANVGISVTERQTQALNGLTSVVLANNSGFSDAPVNITLVTPDGDKFAEWQLPSLIRVASASGTPIVNMG